MPKLKYKVGQTRNIVITINRKLGTLIVKGTETNMHMLTHLLDTTQKGYLYTSKFVHPKSIRNRKSTNKLIKYFLKKKV